MTPEMRSALIEAVRVHPGLGEALLREAYKAAGRDYELEKEQKRLAAIAKVEAEARAVAAAETKARLEAEELAKAEAQAALEARVAAQTLAKQQREEQRVKRKTRRVVKPKLKPKARLKQPVETKQKRSKPRKHSTYVSLTSSISRLEFAQLEAMSEQLGIAVGSFTGKVLHDWAATRGVTWRMRKPRAWSPMNPNAKTINIPIAVSVPLEVAAVVRERASDLEITVSMFIRELLQNHFMQLGELWGDGTPVRNRKPKRKQGNPASVRVTMPRVMFKKIARIAENKRMSLGGLQRFVAHEFVTSKGVEWKLPRPRAFVPVDLNQATPSIMCEFPENVMEELEVHARERRVAVPSLIRELLRDFVNKER